MKNVRLALMGFGNAAQAFLKILIEKEQVLQEQGFAFQVTAITTGTKGNLVNDQGMNFREILNQLEINGHFRQFGSNVSQKTTQEIIDTAAYDVLIELTPLNIFSGQPAIDHIRGAMKREKHVITANKGPIAWEFKDLQQLSKQQGVQFLYETTVMDGTPIFNLVRETLPHCQVTEIKGILNSTTNFILGELEKGEAYEDIMEEGRRRGFVEADSSLDTEGWDAAAKLTALMNVLMDANLKPDQIDRTGIAGITAEALQEAKQQGMSLKLLCHGLRTPEGIKASVKPTRIPMTDIYANIDATSSIVSIRTDLMGEISIVEHNPEIEQTGFGIFSDLMTLIKSI